MLVEDGEGSNHPVLLYDYQIQSHLITYTDYAQCVEAGECEPSGDGIVDSAPAGVNWYQAQAYCEYLGGRLPTEAELSKLTQTDEDCPDSDYRLGSQEGFGEWVYDWDDPDYYNDSLVTNPFGPAYGDLKLVLGLDLDLLSQNSDKFKIETGDSAIYAKYTGREYKIEIKEGEYKVEDKVDGKETEFKSRGSDNAGFFPRLGMLPDSFNPLVGFRCVTQGAALAYAPICRISYEAYCSAPAESLTVPGEGASDGMVDPNFNIIAASCPSDDRVNITIEHDLSSAEGIKVNDPWGQCECQEYSDYPGKLFCNCTSPGEENYLNVDVCDASTATLISLSDFCPDGYSMNPLIGACSPDSLDPVRILSWDTTAGDEGDLSCPSSARLSVPTDGYPGMSAAMVHGVSESTVPDGDEWTLFSISDGSGMCAPGYYFNKDTQCCLPISKGNYGCDEGQYFDAGLKQCLPLHQDGCGPYQMYDYQTGCIPEDNNQIMAVKDLLEPDNDDGVTFEEYIRSGDGSDGGGIPYFDAGFGLCVETLDGCPVGFYLDSDNEVCIPISGPKSPCSIGYTLDTDYGCCVPAPGEGGSECPAGMEYSGAVCSPGYGGCPPSHYYDAESDCCLLRTGGRVCGLLYFDEKDAETCQIDPETGDPLTDPTTGTEQLNVEGERIICGGDTYFDSSLGICRPKPAVGDVFYGSLFIHEVNGQFVPIKSYSGGDLEAEKAEASSGASKQMECSIFSSDKTFQFAYGFCRPRSAGDGSSEDHFTVEFEEGRIASITRVSPDVLDPAAATAPPTEDDICQGSTRMYAEGVCLPGDCTNLQISIPPCPRVPSSSSSGGSGPNCGAISVWGTCDNTPGCHWEINQNKCVAD